MFKRLDEAQRQAQGAPVRVTVNGAELQCRAGDSERRPIECLDGCDFDAVGEDVISQHLVELVDRDAGIFLIFIDVVVAPVKALADFLVFGVIHGPELALDGDVLIEPA